MSSSPDRKEEITKEEEEEVIQIRSQILRLNRNVIIDETRAFRDKNKILVKLNLISDKLDLDQSNNTSVCTITDHVTNKDNAIETPYSQFCKYALGVSKFSSTTGVLNELDRCPISIKACMQSISYWHRLETGQNGSLIENSYLECKLRVQTFILSKC